MKILRVYFKEILMSVGHRNSVDSSNHTIEQLDIGYLIDSKVIVPFSNCREILVSCEEERFFPAAISEKSGIPVTMFSVQEQVASQKKKKSNRIEG